VVAVKVTEQVPALPPVVAVVQLLALSAAPAPGEVKLNVVACVLAKAPAPLYAVAVIV
jgi:hypothetical protein